MTKPINGKQQSEPEPVDSLHIMTHLDNFLKNLDKTQYFAELVTEFPDMELTALPERGIVWFRYAHSDLHSQDLDGVNRMILYEMWRNNQSIEDEVKDGKYSLKISNLTQSFTELDMFIEQIRCAGKNIVIEYL